MMSPGASSNLGQRSYALFPLEGEAALIVKSLMAADDADLPVKDIRVYGDSGVDFSLLSQAATPVEVHFLNLLRNTPRNTSAIDALVSALRDRKLTEANVGIEMEGLSSELRTELARALPKARLLDCTNLIRLIRAVKTPDEISRLARAAEIAERAGMESITMAKAGGRAKDLVQHFRSSVAEQGADFDHFSFSLGGLGICTEPDYIFQPDDVLFIDYGCVFSSYFSDTGTTLAFSDLNPEMAKRYQALKSCFDAGVSMMRPGVKSSAIQKTMSVALEAGGVAGSFPHGHGMGMELRDYPILVPSNGLEIRDDCIAVDSDLPLEEGMVINLETPLFLPTAGALQIEKTFVVTADGCCELSPQDRTRPYISA
jgi:Xaa-Pro dipeptidase